MCQEMCVWDAFENLWESRKTSKITAFILRISRRGDIVLVFLRPLYQEIWLFLRRFLKPLWYAQRKLLGLDFFNGKSILWGLVGIIVQALSKDHLGLYYNCNCYLITLLTKAVPTCTQFMESFPDIGRWLLLPRHHTV